MRTLPYDVMRCAGRMDFDGDGAHWCKQRHSCQRYKAFSEWDKKAGIPDYVGIPVALAVPACEIKIEVEHE